MVPDVVEMASAAACGGSSLYFSRLLAPMADDGMCEFPLMLLLLAVTKPAAGDVVAVVAEEEGVLW